MRDTSSFSGNYYEIGRQQGIIFKEKGFNFDNITIDPDLYQNQLQIYKKHYPEQLEEIHGMADGGDYDAEKLTYVLITGEIQFYTSQLRLDKACTIFGCKVGEKLFVGRNYDWIPEAEKGFEVYRVENPDRNSFLAVTDMGIGDAEASGLNFTFYYPDDAINDKGLFVGLTFAFADQWAYGISSIHMTKLIAEKCATIADAERIFNEVPLCCPKNFFIADKNGDMMIVEHTSKKVKFLYPQDDLLIKSNHYVDKELAEKDETVLKRVPFHNTFIRYYETLQRINFDRENLELDSVIKILGDPSSYTCQNIPGMKTIWTLALDMTKKQYKIFWDLHGERKEKDLKV